MASSTSIGTISAKLTASSTAFTKNLQTAEGRLRGMRGAASSAASGFATLRNAVVGVGAAFAAFSAVNKLKTMVTAEFANVDALGKAADMLGIATEALAGFHHHAELAGVKSEQFNMSMAKLTRAIGEAARGGATQAAIFEELGLSAERLSLTTPENQLKAVADRLESVTNSTDRTRLAMQLFGEEGLKMVNVLRGGAAALEASQAEAVKLGLAVSTIDRIKIEMANDAMTRLQGLVTGVARQLAVQLAPFVASAAEKLVAMGSAGEGMGERVLSAVEFVATAAAKLADVIDLGKIAWIGVKTVALLALESMVAGMTRMAEAGLRITEMFASVLPEAVVTFHRSYVDAIGGIEDGLRVLREDAERSFTDALIQQSASERVARFFREIRTGAEAQAAAIAASAAERVAYNETLLESLKLTEAELAASKLAKTLELPELAGVGARVSADRGIPFLRAGSAEAEAFVFDAQFRRQETIQEKQLRVAQKSEDLLDRIARNTEDAGEGVPVYF